MAPGNYNGPTLKTAIQTALNLVYPVSQGSFTVDYDNASSTITISTNSVTNLFYVLSDFEVANDMRGLWVCPDVIVSLGGYTNKSNIASINDILRNLDHETAVCGRFDFRSGFLNFQTHNNLYLSSPNLGTFSTMGTRGESTIIKKIPVSAEFGYMIIDRSASVHDYLECGKCTLKTIDFELKDSKGRYIPLHGANISFSIVFAIKAED